MRFKLSHRILAFFVIALFNMSCTTSPEDGITDIPAEAFSQKMASDPGFVLDVRSEEEFEAGHLKGAANIHVNGPDFETGISGLDKESLIYVYCGSGVRSMKAARIMKDKGFKHLVNMSDGIQGWNAAGLPIE